MRQSRLAVVADTDKGCTLRSAGAAVVLDSATLEEQPAAFATLNVDDVMGRNAGVLCGVLTHDGARLGRTGVHDVSPARNRQRRLALARAAVKGVAVQIERDIFRGNRDVLFRVGQQLHHCPFLSSIDSRLQAGIALTAHFGDSGLGAFLGSWSLGTFSVGLSHGGCFIG